MCFFFLSLSLQEQEAYPIEFIEINIPQGFLDIAIKHCVVHLLELTIILEQIILVQFF